jgi:hypothetical protein
MASRYSAEGPASIGSACGVPGSVGGSTATGGPGSTDAADVGVGMAAGVAATGAAPGAMSAIPATRPMTARRRLRVSRLAMPTSWEW